MSDRSQEMIEYYNSRPTKQTSAGVLIRSPDDGILLVKPTYRKYWAWPGGGVEDGEWPSTAAVRECTEEIGICPPAIRPAFVNYIPARPDGSRDVVHFIFETRIDDSAEFMRSVILDGREIDDAKFVPTSMH